MSSLPRKPQVYDPRKGRETGISENSDTAEMLRDVHEWPLLLFSLNFLVSFSLSETGLLTRGA